MTFLPIVERELHARARSGTTYWVRLGVALAGIVICLLQFAFSDPQISPSAAGRQVFDGLVATALLLSCGACLLTADVVSGERREGTLGLLLLTRVNRFDVLLGKLGSSGVSALCAAAVLLPVLMIPVLAGGATGGDAFRAGVALLNVLFFALTAGLFASSCHLGRFQAVRDALVIVGSFLLVPLVIPGLRSLSPLESVLSATGFPFLKPPGSYSVSLGTGHLAAWGLLWAAAAQLHRTGQEQGGGESVDSIAAEAAEPAPTVALRPRRWRPLAPGTGPIEWLVCRQRGMRTAAWTATCLALVYSTLLPFGFGLAGETGSIPTVFSQVLALPISLITGSLFAWVASRFYVEARRSGELEMLLTTPVGARAMMAAQWKVLAGLLLLPTAVMVAPTSFWFLKLLAATPGGQFPPGVLLYYALGVLLYTAEVVLGLGALCWAGMWFGIRSRGQAEAILWTVGLTKAIPLLVNWLGLALFQILSAPISPSGVAPSYIVFSSLLRVGLLLWYLSLIRYARRCLCRELAGAGAVRQSEVKVRADTFRPHARALVGEAVAGRPGGWMVRS